ncbi:ABC transporter ATP-binding protein [Paenibacillus septentrionalis]|uniref:ABC transporter ATP-binding protein n=1 Tax=Paenibacillus septentrionalis TaxID=429342 RepID=A0ABW1V5U3_9BACL
MNLRNSEVARLASYIKQRRASYLVSLFSSSLVESSVPIVMAVMLKFILDSVVEESMSQILKLCIVLALMIICLFILTRVFQYWFGKTVQEIMVDFRMMVFRHMIRLPVSYYENTHSADSLSRINTDLSVVEHAFTGDIRPIVTQAITGGGSAIIMFFLDWRLALALIAMGILSTFINSKFAKPLRVISNQIQKHTAVQSERLTDLIAGMHVSRMFQLTDKMNEKFRDTNHLLAKLEIARTKRYAALNGTNYILIWINNMGAFALGSFMLLNGQTTLGTLLSLVLLLDHVANLFRNMGSMWANLQSSLAGASRIFELMDHQKEPERYLLQAPDEKIETEQATIEFRNVVFGYKQKKIIDGLDFRVEQGQMVAFVGPSGGGKSTIFKLLLGYYPFEQGEIIVEGRNISEYSLEQLRDRIAYVSQDSYLFSGTIEENIRYGRLNATLEEIVEAAKVANAHQFICELPDGYQTIVGERGARLSGGQKQRIAIARSLLKDAQILLLDEATSALDSNSELAVQRGLQRLMEGKTTIAIAHRLSTIQQADKIYVIDGGKVLEQGNHNELLAQCGIYSRLHSAQEKSE